MIPDVNEPEDQTFGDIVWIQFKKNRVAYWSLWRPPYLFSFLFLGFVVFCFLGCYFPCVLGSLSPLVLESLSPKLLVALGSLCPGVVVPLGPRALGPRTLGGSIENLIQTILYRTLCKP